MSQYEKIMQSLHGRDIYENFDASAFNIDLQGWGSTHTVFAQAAQRIRPDLVIEVGSWKGASAIHIAKLLEPHSVVVCVDTWLGTINNFLGQDGIEGDSLQRKNGYPTLYFQFLANTVLSGVRGKIIPLPQTSNNAAAILAKIGVRPDLIYLDGSHEVMDVYQDLSNYYPLLNNNGALIGDDFARDSVKTAVIHFKKNTGAVVYSHQNKFIFFKNRRYSFSGFKKL
ncbi:MAG: class I SAM-dependent methyltransferase [Desulfomicrobium sp.]|nr:class I SAM-dependent methyltransferase [Desulfomicrobium sp.]